MDLPHITTTTLITSKKQAAESTQQTEYSAQHTADSLPCITATTVITKVELMFAEFNSTHQLGGVDVRRVQFHRRGLEAGHPSKYLHG
jgi:hypothetical protein